MFDEWVLLAIGGNCSALHSAGPLVGMAVSMVVSTDILVSLAPIKLGDNQVFPIQIININTFITVDHRFICCFLFQLCRSPRVGVDGNWQQAYAHHGALAHPATVLRMKFSLAVRQQAHKQHCRIVVVYCKSVISIWRLFIILGVLYFCIGKLFFMLPLVGNVGLKKVCFFVSRWSWILFASQSLARKIHPPPAPCWCRSQQKLYPSFRLAFFGKCAACDVFTILFMNN